MPIYDASIYLVVSDKIGNERKKFDKLFGKYPDEDYRALHCYDSAGSFGMFFDARYVEYSVICHEVFHLTHRVLDWANTNFDKDHHEHAALLNGYLNAWVINFAKKYKLLRKKT